jgi:hypothetical protein
MSRDPFGLNATEQAAAPAPQSSPGWHSLAVGVLLGAAALLAFQRFAPDGIPYDREGDQQEQVEPATDGNTLIFVHERNPQPIEHDLLLREMPAFCEANGLSGGFRALDDDLTDPPVPQLIQFAQTRGVVPPFVVLTDKSDKPVKAASWPTDLEALKGFIR